MKFILIEIRPILRRMLAQYNRYAVTPSTVGETMARHQFPTWKKWPLLDAGNMLIPHWREITVSRLWEDPSFPRGN
jgi:hypothetical protein